VLSTPGSVKRTNGTPAGDLQMATDRTSIDSLRGPLVSSVLAFLRDVEELLEERFGSRLYDRVALGAAVCSGIGAADEVVPWAETNSLQKLNP
jgi:hypothetical protein